MTHDTDQLVIDQTCRVIDQAMADVENGGIDEQTALAILAAECLATSIEAHHAGRLGLAAWLVEQASRFAVQRRAAVVASMAVVPDDASGLE